MLARNIRILDFDGSVKRQQGLLLKYRPQIIGLEDLSSRARLWMSRETAEIIRRRIPDSPFSGVTFLGSGDFHHLSSLLIEQFKEPFSLIVFDFHPDWDILPPRLGCGSWVTEALRNPRILQCLLIGVSSSDISAPGIQSGNLRAFKGGRLKIYPYRHSPSAVFLRKVPENSSLKLKKGFLATRIFWEELEGKDLRDFFLKQASALPVKEVYVSIDKDCLGRDYALTNWEEGRLPLEGLLTMLRVIKDSLNIVGLDITGDYSQISVSGILKKVISRLDHPRHVEAEKAAREEIDSINEAANLKILEALYP